MNLGIYIHWPFCKSKCPYCDFNSHVRASVDEQRFAQAYLRELEYMASLAAKNARVVSVFFGGGTPSLMPPSLVEKLLQKIADLWNISDQLEVTLEANPTSSEAANFQAFRNAGVNRLSLGIQSLDENALRFLGREHSAREAINAIQLAQKIFPRYSFDLIYARPEQTLSDWQTELKAALNYVDEHFSLYQLTIENGTGFAKDYAKGIFTLPEEDIAIDLYNATSELLANKGLYAYEISNYAKPSAQCRHNLLYWRGEAYIGIGAGAHGRLCDAQNEWRATNTQKTPERWLEQVERLGHGLEDNILLDAKERAEERLIMGLRLQEGVDKAAVAEIINQSGKELLLREGLLRETADKYQLTDKSWLLLDGVIRTLVS